MGFFELWHKYEVYIRRLIRSISDSDDDAKEILQETMQKAWLNYENLRSDFAFGKWISRIARNCSADYYRKPGNRIFQNYVELEKRNEAEQTYTEENMEEQIITRDVLRRYISDLKKERAKVLYLNLIGGYGATKISRMLKLNYETVKKWLYCDKRKISELLRTYLDDAD